MDQLYREQILEHYKRPHNFGPLEEFDLEFEDSNPFCGDEQHVRIRLDEDDRVAEVRFEGKGCAISTAATSLLSDEIEGMSREELLRLDKEKLDTILERHPNLRKIIDDFYRKRANHTVEAMIESLKKRGK